MAIATRSFIEFIPTLDTTTYSKPAPAANSQNFALSLQAIAEEAIVELFPIFQLRTIPLSYLLPLLVLVVEPAVVVPPLLVGVLVPLPNLRF